MKAERLISGLSMALAVMAGIAATVAVGRADAANQELDALRAQEAPMASAPAERVEEQKASPEGPGFGERMNSFARRFAGLWYAGRSGNFELAKYELHEMEEVIEGIEPLQKVENGVNINGVLAALENTQLKAMEEAVEAKDKVAFEKAYRETMKACNACHTSSAHEFIRIGIPVRKPVVNRDYEPIAADTAPEVVKVSDGSSND
ncbi:MAG: hypothetical protein ACYTGZ_15560 [Planctomycetota bacterium]|jgi:hypothetical protein